MKQFVQIEDCQNNVVAIIQVEAKDKAEAKYKALRALHADDNLYIIDEEDARGAAEDGYIIIDENGEEVDFDDWKRKTYKQDERSSWWS